MDNSITPGSEIPLGLGMAFAQNTDAMKTFSSLSVSEQKSVVERAKSVKLKEEMQALVEDLRAKN